MTELIADKTTSIMEPLDEMDVDIAIAEALALIPNGTTYEDKGTEVRKALQKMGLWIVRAA